MTHYTCNEHVEANDTHTHIHRRADAISQNEKSYVPKLSIHTISVQPPGGSHRLSLLPRPPVDSFRLHELSIC